MPCLRGFVVLNLLLPAGWYHLCQPAGGLFMDYLFDNICRSISRFGYYLANIHGSLAAACTDPYDSILLPVSDGMCWLLICGAPALVWKAWSAEGAA